MNHTAPDTVAATYVDLTIAIVTLQEQVKVLQEQIRALSRHQLAICTNLDALQKVGLEQVALLKEIGYYLTDEDTVP